MPLVQGTTSRESSPERHQTRVIIANDANELLSNRILTRILGQAGQVRFHGFSFLSRRIVQ